MVDSAPVMISLCFIMQFADMPICNRLIALFRTAAHLLTLLKSRQETAKDTFAVLKLLNSQLVFILKIFGAVKTSMELPKFFTKPF